MTIKANSKIVRERIGINRFTIEIEFQPLYPDLGALSHFSFCLVSVVSARTIHDVRVCSQRRFRLHFIFAISASFFSKICFYFLFYFFLFLNFLLFLFFSFFLKNYSLFFDTFLLFFAFLAFSLFTFSGLWRD